MLQPNERDALEQAITLAQNAITRMVTIISSLSSKRELINQLFSMQIPNIQPATLNTIETLSSYVPRLTSIAEKLCIITSVEDDIPDVFKKFLQNEFVSFDWNTLSLANESIKTAILAFMQRQVSDKLIISPTDTNTIRWIRQLPHNYHEHVTNFERKFAQFQIFNKIKWINNNIVMIGANGSGKSTFARQLKGKISSNVSILSAQHLLIYRKADSIPTGKNEIAKIQSFQKSNKLSSDSDFSNLIGNDMNQLITALIAEHTDRAYEHFDGAPKKESFLNKVVSIWAELLEHRELLIERGFLSVKPSTTPKYDFNNLSDGEKAVFYYIGHVLLVEQDSYIVIDEPENHLNLAICNKLWDKLENERPDCKFIYLTHNLDFAVSRTNTTVIWNKQFTAPDIWDFEIIESDDTMPDTLLMEVLGSRKNICFCEGKDKSYLDYKLYSVLFPEYTIIPVGGHLDVINYTNAYNKSSVCVNRAIGIIDGDCHLDAQIAKWQQHQVYTIPINEIENLLCDPLILEKATSTFMSGDNAVQNFYNEFWTQLERKKNMQTVWYINNILNNRFKDHFLHEKSDLEILKTELQQITSTEEIDSEYEARLHTLTISLRHVTLKEL